MNLLARPPAAVLDVEAAAAKHLTVALRRYGCTVHRQDVGTVGLLQADVWKGAKHLLMCLLAAVAPSEPAGLSADEAKAFRLEAKRTNADPWVAYVVLDPDMELKRLDWRPLEAPRPSV